MFAKPRMQIRAGETNTTRALARMAHWAQARNDISKAEFLEYDVLAKFQEFFVTDTGNSSSANAPSHAANIPYLANVFKVDPAKLIHQTEQHKPIVVSEKRKGPTLTTIGVWPKALERTQSTSKRPHTYHVDALRPTLQFLAAPWSAMGTRTLNRAWPALGTRTLSKAWYVLGTRTC
jgi:hypothetical protein